jgi:hypothetical protein
MNPPKCHELISNKLLPLGVAAGDAKQALTNRPTSIAATASEGLIHQPPKLDQVSRVNRDFHRFASPRDVVRITEDNDRRFFRLVNAFSVDLKD